MVGTLSKLLTIPAQIVTMGDLPNDVLMFKKSGFSIAMGKAGDEVKAQASAVADSNEEEGFVNAIRKFVLRQATCMLRSRQERAMTLDCPTRRVLSPALSLAIAKPVIAVVMGVSGSGKTTVAVLLAAAFGCQFQEGDDLHPAANVEKMHSGKPLTDADRLPWLNKIAEEIDGWHARGESGVLTCSALKRSYRDIVIGGRLDVTLVYLKGSHDLIHRRMAARHEHFMPLALLDSQFATLQEPTPDEHPLTVDVAAKPAEVVAEILHQLELRQGLGQRDEVVAPGRGS